MISSVFRGIRDQAVLNTNKNQKRAFRLSFRFFFFKDLSLFNLRLLFSSWFLES